MKLIQGVVQKINVKAWDGKNLYSFFIRGQDGMFSLGEHPPSFKEGDSIKFETVQKGRYINAVNVVPWEGTGTATAPAVQNVARSSGRSNYVGGRSGKSDEEKAYWQAKDAKQDVIQKKIEIQAARNAAIEAAKFLIEKEFVKTPTKQADKYDSYLALVDQLATEFLTNTANRFANVPAAETITEVVHGTTPGSVAHADETGWE